jgi:2-oxoglutarate ferredoxin oxidoreductase subunit alpha
MAGEIPQIKPFLWDKKSPYKRYLFTENNVSPLAFVPCKDEILKVNSYEHDELGITTEDSRISTLMQEKRLGKEKNLAEELENIKTVNVYQGQANDIALLCWGSNKGVCVEVGQKLGLKVIQPVVLNPFPIRQLRQALSGVNKLISVESNATGQLARLVDSYGIRVDEQVLKYDGRQLRVEELEKKIKEVIR